MDRANIRAPEPDSTGAAPPDARTAEIASWLGQFSRTLKTCRLYDARNPNSIKFRQDLGAQLVALLATHGQFRLEFTAQGVSCDGQMLVATRGADGNFAMPFYRDGVRGLTFVPGFEPAELDTMIDLLLRVTGVLRSGAEDLVTLLWDADLPHLDMNYVSSETDADLGDDGDVVGDAPQPAHGAVMPWPGGSGNTAFGAALAAMPQVPAGAAGGAGLAGSLPETPEGVNAVDSATELRSEDWLAGEPASELEALCVDLDANSAEEVDRFMTALHQDRSTQLIPATLSLVRDTLRSDLQEGDRRDLMDLLLRLLHESIGSANWADASNAVDCLTECSEGQWDAASLIETLGHPESVVTGSLVRFLDGHPLAQVHEFVQFARSLGPAAVEWVMGIVAVANHQRTRRTLVRALGELCEDNPERLAPWLADPRWYVVRNAVIAVASADGGAPVGLLKPLVRHTDLRVRQEVVAALAGSDPDAARPLLLELIRDEEPSIRGAALHQLGSRRNAQASAALLALVMDPAFRKSTLDEVRSVTNALGGCAGDEVLPQLEEQLYAPSWFSQGAGPYCQAIARCMARIGSEDALARIERGALSRVPATRDACKLVLKGLGRG